MNQFTKPLELAKSNQKKTNSFINDENIFLIASTDDELVFRTQNFESGTLVKEYVVNVNDTIAFKNSPIIQEGGAYDSYREMDKTKKFLRKITSGDVGVSVNSYANGYKIEGAIVNVVNDAQVVVTFGSAIIGKATLIGGATTKTASDTSVDATLFDGNLAPTDTDLQKVAQKVDDLVVGGGGGGSVYEISGYIDATTTLNWMGILNTFGDKNLFNSNTVKPKTGDLISLSNNFFKLGFCFKTTFSTKDFILSGSYFLLLIIHTIFSSFFLFCFDNLE
mgnify:CR=1 FL=1